MSDNSVLTLQRKSSRYLAVLLLIAHLASLGLVWLISVPLWIKVVLNGLLIISVSFYLRQDALLLSDTAVTTFTLTTEQKIVLTTRSGTIIHGSLLSNTFVSPFLTVMLIQPHNQWIPCSIVLLPDSLDVEAFRKLRVWLRWR